MYASLTGALLDQITPAPKDPAARPSRVYELLQANDFAGIQQLFTALFDGIPADWYRNNAIARYEGYYTAYRQKLRFPHVDSQKGSVTFCI